MKKEVGLLHLAVMLFGLAGVIGKFVTTSYFDYLWTSIFFFNFSINNNFNKKRES